MTRLQVLRTVVVLVVTLVLLVGSALPAFAQEDACPTDLYLPAGNACADFDLNIVVGCGGHGMSRVFTDKDGNVRSISAGTGTPLLFTNVSTGENFSTISNGSVWRKTFNADGTIDVVATGHSVIILFPTDVPAGPSTTLYVGQVVYRDDGYSNFTLLRTSGKSMDICAALSD